MNETRTALIVGSSRGLGLAITEELLSRGWNVIATKREGKTTGLDDLAEKWKDQLTIQTLDINEESQIEVLSSKTKDGSLDLLFVNAGVANKNGMKETIAEISTEEFIRVMVTNTLSPMRVLERLARKVPPGGILGAMSSGQGSITNNERGGNDVYRASKAALNMIMRSFAIRYGTEHSILLLAPGWIQTEMGGPNASFTVQEVIPDIVDTILSQEHKIGLRYLDRFGNDVPW